MGHKQHNNTFEGFQESVRQARIAIWRSSWGNHERLPRYAALSIYLHFRGIGTSELVKYADGTKFWKWVWKAERLPSKPSFRSVYMHKLRPALVAAEAEGRFNPQTGELVDSAAVPTVATPSGANGHAGRPTSTGSAPPQRMRQVSVEPQTAAADVIALAIEQLTAQQIIDVIQDELTAGVEVRSQLAVLETQLLEANIDANHWREEATRLQGRVNQLGSQLGQADMDFQRAQEQIAELQEAAASGGRGSLRLFSGGQRV